jgi:hypothetical protein
MPRPPKTFKSLDDDEDITNILKEAANEISDTSGENSFLDEIPTEDVEDDVQVSSADGDFSVSVGSVRRNKPPEKCWADGIRTPFVVGDLVYLKGSPDKIFKVLGPYSIPNTYNIKLSGTDNEQCNVREDIIRKAKPDAVWVPIWETVVDPYRDWKRKQEEALKVKVTEVSKNKHITKKVLKNTKKK